MSIESDFKTPLNEVYASLPESTQKWIDSQIKSIHIYFFVWLAYIVLSLAIILFVTLENPFNQPTNEWFARSGSLMTLFPVLGEAVFLIKLNELVKITHPAQLSCEIYVERRFKPLLTFSVMLTLIHVSVGTIVWGYGDLLYIQL